MAKNIIGIDISDFSIEAVALEKSKGHFKLASYSRFRLSPEIVEDGQVLNPQKLKDAILKMFKNAKPRAFDQSYKVFLSIPESQTFSRVLALPKHIKDKDLKRVAIDKAEEIIPESVDKLTALVKILPDSEKHKHVFYAAAETEVLKTFVNIFNELDIEVAGITTETISSFTGLKKSKDKKNTLLLDLGARTTIASVFTKECLCSSISIGIGGDNITKAIATKLNIPYQNAEEKKKQIGLTPDEEGQTMLISQGQLQPLVDELKVFIKYWQDLSGQSIEQIILVGGLAQMKGADKYFGDNLNLPIQLGELFIDSKNLPIELVSTKYINAFGLAKLAHQGTDIDFYKKLTKKKKGAKKGDNKKKDSHEEKKMPKFSKKNIILISIILILFLSMGAIFIFRDKLWSFSNKPDTQVNLDINNEIKEPLNLEEKILVSTANIDNNDNFIQGEYYEFEFNKVYSPPADIALKEGYTGDFANGLERLESEANQEILTLLNDSYAQEGYYIIPNIISHDIIEASTNEESYVIGGDVMAGIQYKFMMFSEENLKIWLTKKYPYLEGKIDTLEYNIINYGADDISYHFNIYVFVNKE